MRKLWKLCNNLFCGSKMCDRGIARQGQEAEPGPPENEECHRKLLLRSHEEMRRLRHHAETGSLNADHDVPY